MPAPTPTQARPLQPPAAAPRFIAGDKVAVLLPLPLSGAYDYRVAAGQDFRAGDFVQVPLGRRAAQGVVWGKGEGDVAPTRLKDITGRLDAPPLDETSRRFIDWVAAYTLTPAGAVLKMAMSVPAALAPPKPVRAYALNPKPPALRMTPLVSAASVA